MEPYHKIQTVFKRDPNTKYKTLLPEYALPEFEYLKDNIWVYTEKVHGMNIRVMSFPSGNVVFTGKTNNAQLPAKLVTRLNEMFPPNGKLHKQFPDGVCLYGEGYGAGIQKGGGKYKGHQDFVLFDVRVGDWWLGRQDVDSIAWRLSIDIVPILGAGTLAEAQLLVEGGFRSFWGDFEAEGIVLKPDVELFNRNGKRIIAKLKCKDFG